MTLSPDTAGRLEKLAAVTADRGPFPGISAELAGFLTPWIVTTYAYDGDGRLRERQRRIGQMRTSGPSSALTVAAILIEEIREERSVEIALDEQGQAEPPDTIPAADRNCESVVARPPRGSVVTT